MNNIISFSLKDDITKGVGPDKFGYGLYKKDHSGLYFTEETKKKLQKERDDTMRQNFDNLFTEASRAVMFRQQINDKLNKKGDSVPVEFRKKLVDLDKQYLVGDNPINYINALPKKEVHQAYVSYKQLWQEIKGKEDPLEQFSLIDGVAGPVSGLQEALIDEDKDYRDRTVIGDHSDSPLMQWVNNNKGKVAAIISAIGGLCFAITLFTHLRYGTNPISLLIFKLKDKIGDVDDAVRGTPVEAEWNQLSGEMHHMARPEDVKKTIDNLHKFSNKLKRLGGDNFSMTINFSVIEARDEVLNTLRLVFKEMPAGVPQLNQAFLAIQFKYLKERMGTYDIEALKPKVRELSEKELEECNKVLRALLGQIREYNKKPTGNRANKTEDLNKFERLMRDIGTHGKNVIAPVGLGLGAALTAKKLFGDQN